MPDEQNPDPTDRYMAEWRAYQQSLVSGISAGPPPQPPTVPEAADQEDATAKHMADCRARRAALLQSCDFDIRTWRK
jgi:hypothetical protein